MPCPELKDCPEIPSLTLYSELLPPMPQASHRKPQTVCKAFPEMGFEGEALRIALTLTNPKVGTLPSQTVSSLDADRSVII